MACCTMNQKRTMAGATTLGPDESSGRKRRPMEDEHGHSGEQGHDDGSAPIHRRVHDRGRSLSDYWPLLVVIGAAILMASARQLALPEREFSVWMRDFMGGFLVIFSMFKFFDLNGFADGFQMYDLLAKPFRPYAYVYPFIEAGLGLAYLSGRATHIVYAATIVVMGIGSLGIFRALSRKMDINCACMGTILKVPLSTVALVEDLGMVVMAAAMWIAA